MTSRQAGTGNHGLLAIFLVIGSMVVGGLYYVYLTSEPFPPDIVRLVPVTWLVAGFIGFGLGVQALFVNARRFLGCVSVLLSIPNIPLAAIYVLGAMMGG